MKTKKIIHTLLAITFVLGAMAINAQTKIYVHKSSGSSNIYNIADIDSISFNPREGAIDYSKLKLNEVSGVGADAEKFYELINIGNVDIPLTGCKMYYNAPYSSPGGDFSRITGDGNLTWTGSATQVIKAGKLFSLIGRGNPGSFTTGLTAARILIITLKDPEGNVIDRCIRAEDTGEYTITDKSFSRIPDGTGPFYFTIPTPDELNGTETGDLLLVPEEQSKIEQEDHLLFSPKGIAEIRINLSNSKTINDIKNEKWDANYVGKLEGTMHISNSASSGYSAREFYEGKILIEGRGNTTWGVPKRPYNIDLVTEAGDENPVALLGMPEADEWSLLAFWHDRSLMRIPLANYLGQQMDGIAWTPRLRYVELWVNDDYRGLYCLSEKVQRQDNRIQIKKLTDTAEDQVEPRISGGYVLEASTPDKLNEREKAVQFRTSENINFSFKYPKAKNVTQEQRQWIMDYLDEFEAVVRDDRKFKDPVNGFRKYVDIPSFIDWNILHELSKGCDNLFHASIFVHKDRNGKLNMSAPWDFDLSFGNSGVYTEDGNWTRTHPRWFGRMYQDENYAQQYNNRYDELKPLFEKIPEILQVNYQQLEESGAIDREIKKWPQILTSYNSQDGLAAANNYKTHVQYLSEWTMSRNAWCYIALGLNNQEKGDRMKTTRPIIRVLNPERKERGFDFAVKVMKSDDNNNKYTYSWNDGAFNNASTFQISQTGKYWVKIKDEWGNISLTSDTLYFNRDENIGDAPIVSLNLHFDFANTTKYWYTGGSGYSFSLDNVEKHGGKSSLKMENPSVLTENFGQFSGSLPLELFAGKNVEYKGWIKTKGLKNNRNTGLYFRVDGDNISLGFYHTYNNPRLEGDNDWTQVSIKMDVSPQAKYIAFGGVFAGEGTVWFDDLELYINGEKCIDVEL